MPRPGFMVCSQLGGLDQYTNAISCTNILEVIQFLQVIPGQAVTLSSAQMPGGIPKPLFMRVVASWHREEGDTPDQQFQAQLIAKIPGEPQERVLADYGQFCFSTRLHRLIVPELFLPPIAGVGTLFIECRLRRVGEEAWIATQSFPIVVEEMPLSQLQVTPQEQVSPPVTQEPAQRSP